MTCDVIATGSRGNAVILDGAYLIDCGVPFSSLKKHLKKLRMVFLTHIHSDHFNPATLLKIHEHRPSIRFVCCRNLLVPLCGDAKTSPNNVTVLEPGQTAVFRHEPGGELRVTPFALIHATQEGDTFYAMWNGFLEESRWTFLFYEDGHSERLSMAAIPRNAAASASGQEGVHATLFHYLHPVKVFSLGDAIWVVGTHYLTLRPCVYCIIADVNGGFLADSCEGYIPLASTGNSPEGGGITLEPLNLLTDRFRAQFSADGTSKDYHLSPVTADVLKVTVDGVEISDGSYDSVHNIYTFAEAPEKGVNNVEFLCQLSDEDHAAAATKFLSMRHTEAYNGSTDTRIFFYGDGTNVCYYSGTPTYGDGLYVPAGYEIAVDSSASAITGMRRHYTRLMAFKPDGAFSITYDPITLADGTVTAGFYVRPASRDVGNDMDNQIQTVGNYPRTLCGGTLYEWRHTASFYQDERYAKRISENIAVTLAAADPSKIVTCDDDADRTYYMFLNDDAGTVLVNRYDLDVWTVYTGEAFKNIRYADGFHGDLLFANDNVLFRFDPDSAFDAPSSGSGDPVPIQCLWESGYMAFGADYLRKYSSTLWISMLPEPSSKMDITVRTDRRDEYMVKSAGRPLLDFSAVDFSNFSFLISTAPKMQRVRLKVKKFVYYKLIFRVSAPGARATVLGYDQQVRFASHVK